MKILRQNKGFTYLELVIAIPLTLTVMLVLYNVLTTMYQENKTASASVGFYTNSNVLDSKIMHDIAQGNGTVAYIDPLNKQKGFILNSNTYDFTQVSPINYSVLHIQVDIQGNVLKIQTSLGAQTFVKNYKVSVWGGAYE